MNIVAKTIFGAGVCSALFVGFIAPSVSALTPLHTFADTTAQSKIKDGINKAGGNENRIDVGTAIKSIINMMLFALGAISVIMIVIGGIRYTTSNGDSNGIQGAKNTILYAIVGLVVAILAYAMVNFVVDNLVSGGSQSTPTAQYNYV